MSTQLFSWRKCIVGSGLPSTTRHVLMTLSMYMNEHGDSCFPSTRRLAYETGLSERCVCTHLERAATLGWVIKQDAGFRGQKWRANSYVATVPKGAKIVSYGQHAIENSGLKGAEPRSVPLPEGAEPHAEGTEPHDKKVLNEVQSITSVTTPTNSQEEPEPEKSEQKKTLPMKGMHGMVEKIAELFNDNLPCHKPCVIPQPINHYRQDKVREAIRAVPEFANLGMWEWYFSGVDQLEFWNGRDPEKNFKRGMDYFLEPATFLKLYEEVSALEDAA